MSKPTSGSGTPIAFERDLLRFFEKGGPLSRRYPEYEERAPQIAMARQVLSALLFKQKALIEAGTGTGKTFAYLVPALMSGRKIIVSTGTKGLQDQIFYKDLPLLRDLFPDPFKAVLIKGKENYLCRQRFSGWDTASLLPEPENSSLREEIARWGRQTLSGDKTELEGLPEDFSLWKEISVNGQQCLGKGCSFYDTCFITRNRKEMEAADLILVNHHLFFADLALKEYTFGQILSDCDAVIFDEAHLVEEVASGYFGRELSLFDFIELASDAKRELRNLQIGDNTDWERLDRLAGCAQDYFNLFKMPGERRFRLEQPSAADFPIRQAAPLLHLLSGIRSRFLSLSSKGDGAFRIAERADHLGKEAASFLEREESSEIFWGEMRTGIADNSGAIPFLQLHATPLDVAPRLREALFQQDRGMVLTSATLTVNGRFDHFRQRIGLPIASESIFESTYDYPEKGLIYLPAGLPDPASESFTAAAANEILEIIRATSGRALVLSTSHRSKDFYYDYCTGKVDFLLLKQGHASKKELLETFRGNVTSVLFATQGFWQGVDVQGESLSCVIIDKIPFASPADPVVEARMLDLKKKRINPFEAYQVPSAIILLKQGMGRLIRSAEDRGILSVLDPRIRTRPYGKLFLDSLPPCRVTSRRSDIGTFFGSKGNLAG